MILEFICRCDDVTVMLGTQTLAVVVRQEFTTWIWNGGCLMADDLVMSVEGETVFAVLNGAGRYLMPAANVDQLAELIASSG